MKMFIGWSRAEQLANYTLDKDFLLSTAKLGKTQRAKLMKAVGREEWNRCSENILYWLDQKYHPAMPYVYTHDQHIYFHCALCNDGNTYQQNQRKSHLKLIHEIVPANQVEMASYYTEIPTIRPFPLQDYMLPIIEAWQNEQYLFVQKSRDMVATWTIVMLYSWDTFFHHGRQNIFQSETASKTFDLVRRSWQIYKHQPAWLKNVYPARPGAGTTKSGVVRIDTLNSEIMGFPQGADQVRQYHPSGIFLDEAAFQIEAAGTFQSVKPAIENGGRFTAISSANPSWFQYACEDRLDTL